MIDWQQTMAGAMAGVTIGLTGVGGGSLMTPLLIMVFGITPISAVGTDLWFAVGTKMVATRTHHGHGLIDWQVVRRLWAGSLTTSALTLCWLKTRPVDHSSFTILTSALAFTLVLTAVGLLFQKKLHNLGSRQRTHYGNRFKALQLPLTVAAGALLGVLVTLTSVGAGALGVVFLTYLYPRRLTAPRLIATDIAHAIPLAMFAGLGYLLKGDVNFGLLSSLLLGSIPGVIIGVTLSTRFSHVLLRRLLALVLLIIGLKLLLR
jgi:uncharacterized protein